MKNHQQNESSNLDVQSFDYNRDYKNISFADKAKLKI